MGLELLPNHASTALKKLVEQVKHSSSLGNLLSSWLKQAQDLEDVFWQLFTQRYLDSPVNASTKTLVWQEVNDPPFHVASTQGFPDRGWLLISAESDGITTTEEEVEYTSKTDTAFFGVQTTDVHEAGTVVKLAGAKGHALDVIGKIVGEPRANAPNDVEYRMRIRARIRVLLSAGTPADVYAVFRALRPDTQVRLVPHYPAGLSMVVAGALGAADVALYATFLAAAKAAGVGAQLLWQPSNDAGTFTLAQSTTLTASVFDGLGMTLPVVSTQGFPDVGSLLLNPGVAVGTTTYTSKDATHFYGCDISDGCDADSLVCLNPSPGLGLGSSANSSVGGALAGALGVD
jgi:hypothetical protein